jgi:hypothetical protein
VRGHVDSETLAGFREELLPRRKARQVAAHLAHCAQCAKCDAQLADLPGLLARTSAPPMPAALTARIEAALAAEAAARSTPAPAGAAAAETAGSAAEAPGGADAGAAPTQPGNAAGGRRRSARGARPAPAPGRSRLALRIAAAAAAIVVIGGGGYGVTRLLSGGGEAGQASTGSGAPPEAGRAAPSRPEMGTPEHGAAGAGGSGSKARSALESPSASAPMLSTGINYRTDQLKTQVQATIARVHGKAPSPLPSSPVNGTSVLTSCLKRVAGNQRPLLVDTARYNGSPATIIVLTTTSAKTLRVVVVGPHCSATQTDLITSTVIPAPH